jgi:hypothetical protein
MTSNTQTEDEEAFSDHFLQQEMCTAAAPKRVAIMRTKEEDVNGGKVIGASLLCYAVDPTWSLVYFLLGKERKILRWRAGSERWSDFGGSTGGKCAEDTAAKEFLEETLAVVKFFEHDTVPRSQYEDIAAALKAGDYTFKLVFSFPATEQCSARSYVTFVKQIPWDPQAIVRFEECRDMLMNPTAHFGTPRWVELINNNPGIKQVRNAADNVVSVQVKRDFLEKRFLRLWSIPQLRHAIEHNGILARRDGKTERCRAGFCNTLELVLGELAFFEAETLQESTYGSQS